jgi:hypothetical protein
MDDNQTLYTDEKLLQSKKILISFKNHINKVVQAIDSKEINQSTLKTLMDTLDDYYKKYNIDIFSNDESDDDEDDESEEESSNKDKSNTKEDDEDDSEDSDSEDSDSEDKLLKKNIESSTSTSSSQFNSKGNDEKNNKDILFEPFVNGSHIFKRHDYGYDINKNLKNFISNSYIY